MRPLFSALAVVLLSSVAVRAASFGVRDDAHFFSASAVDEASTVVSDINKRFSKDVLIESFPAIPDDMKVTYDAARRDAFFRDWAAQRAKAAGVNGIYMLICKEPSYLRVSVGNETRKQAFTLDDAQRLSDDMRAAFRAKEFDRGLTDGVRFIAKRMQENTGVSSGAAGASRDSSFPQENGGSVRTSPMPAPAPSPAPTPMPSPRTAPPGSGFGLGSCIIPLLVLVFIVWIIRRVMAPRNPMGGGGQMPGQGGPYPPGYGGGGGGGGFGRGILGGLLGGMAGGWLQDRMSHGNDSSAHGGSFSPPDSGGGAGGGFSSGPSDTDFSSGSGGGFDDGGSGGSFGDSGGGGSDSSGSGGDF